MSVIPPENYKHVSEIAWAVLDGYDDYPDIRKGGRWIKVQADRSTPQFALARLGERLSESGYHVSVMGPVVKATKKDVQWPAVDESDRDRVRLAADGGGRLEVAFARSGDGLPQVRSFAAGDRFGVVIEGLEPEEEITVQTDSQ